MRAIYPASMLNERMVDEFFYEEASKLTEPPALFINSGSVPAVSRIIEGETYLYRGWILTVEDYTAMEAAVSQAGANLVVSTEQYAYAQYAENYLVDFASLTAPTVVVRYDATDEEILQTVRVSGLFEEDTKFFIKGSSKSAKHNKDASIAEGIESIPETLRHFRNEVIEDFILIRKFVDYVGNEYRIWFMNGEETSVGLHPQLNGIYGENLFIWNKEDAIPLNTIVNEIREVIPEDSGFVTVDVMRNSSTGDFQVVEVGSGCVSESRDPMYDVLLHTNMSDLYN